VSSSSWGELGSGAGPGEASSFVRVHLSDSKPWQDSAYDSRTGACSGSVRPASLLLRPTAITRTVAPRLHTAEPVGHSTEPATR